MSEVNLSALTTEALGKSDILWLRLPTGERMTWFATGSDDLDGHVLLVSGGAEDDLGPLPEQLELVLRSKGNGGRLLTLRARPRGPDSRQPVVGPRRCRPAHRPAQRSGRPAAEVAQRVDDLAGGSLRRTRAGPGETRPRRQRPRGRTRHRRRCRHPRATPPALGRARPSRLTDPRRTRG
uniref:Uncharacterized protein n=1 Tax=Janibacter limosus TaxID=53458 RepID=A0AC61U623_9MICO|nr:hypothetical protein [Janibacter limosus]